VVRRRVLNAAMINGLLSLAGWFAAGMFYLVVLRTTYGLDWVETLRIVLTIVLVGGPVSSALAFLVSEYHWRREIPLFFPDGVLERDGVLRVPIRVRLFLTFLLTSILPLMLMTILDLRLGVACAPARPTRGATSCGRTSSWSPSPVWRRASWRCWSRASSTAPCRRCARRWRGWPSAISRRACPCAAPTSWAS
jgi:hypothetical protein